MMENNYNVSVDAGENIKELLQQLASHIGVTVDKIFPWYVKNEVIEGYTNLTVLSVIAAVALVALVVGCIKADFDRGNVPAVVALVSGMVLAFCLFAGSMAMPTMIGQINNPEYFATKELVKDISSMKP